MEIDVARFTGKWTKLLRAFAALYGLEHTIKVDDEGNVAVDVIVKNDWYSSVIDVFEEGRLAYVSSLSKYVFADESKSVESIVEAASKEILEGTFGERRYLKSMKGGDGAMTWRMRSGKLELVEVPPFVVRDLPRSLDELMIKLSLAGIDSERLEKQMDQTTSGEEEGEEQQ